VRLPGLQAAWRAEGDVTVAAWLAVALGELGDREAKAALPGLVDRAGEIDDELRAHAALARARFAAVPPIGDLALALHRASDVNLRCALMHALARAGTPAAGATLVGEYEPVRSRICCAEALATLHDPATLPFILDRLAGEPYSIVQAALVRALGRIGDRRAIEALRSLRAASPEVELVRAVDDVLADLDS
jgi:HEAT repeat protein